MEKTNNSQLFAYGGLAAMVLGLFISYIKIPMLGGLSLLLDMGKLGNVSSVMYVIAILGIAVAAYAGYVTFKSKKDLMMAAYAGAGYFVILIIFYFVMKGKIAGEMGDFAELMGAFFKMGIAPFFFLVGGVSYYFADKHYKAEQNVVKE